MSVLTVAEVPVAEITGDPNQPRKAFRDIESLAGSIAAKGLLQPITIRPRPDGEPGYYVVAGERRFRAVCMNGSATIPAIIRANLEETEVFELQLLENLARAEMNPIEEAAGLQLLLDAGKTAAELEASLGIGSGSGAEVTYKVRLLRVIEPVRVLLERRQFSVSMAVTMSRLTPNGQMKAVRELNEKGLGSNAFTALVEGIFKAENQTEMFAETKIDEATRQKADTFREALRRLSRDARTVAEMDAETLSAAFIHELPRLEAEIAEAMAALTKARRGVQRQSGHAAAVQAVLA